MVRVTFTDMGIKGRRSLLNGAKAAEILGISQDTLRRWAVDNKGPARIRVGKRYYYTAEIIRQWIKAMSVAS